MKLERRSLKIVATEIEKNISVRYTKSFKKGFSLHLNLALAEDKCRIYFEPYITDIVRYALICKTFLVYFQHILLCLAKCCVLMPCTTG